MRGIHWSPVNSPHKGQWRGALVFTLIWARINGWENNCEAGDLRRNFAHYDVIVMIQKKQCLFSSYWSSEQEIVTEISPNKKGPNKNYTCTRPVIFIRNGFHMFPGRNHKIGLTKNIGLNHDFPIWIGKFSLIHVLKKKNSRSCQITEITFSSPFFAWFTFSRREKPYHVKPIVFTEWSVALVEKPEINYSIGVHMNNQHMGNNRW